MPAGDDSRDLIEFDIARAKRLLRARVAADPRSFDARVLLGDAHLRALEFPEAINQYQVALGIRPTSGLVISKLALCGFYTGRYADALPGFEALHQAGRDDLALALSAICLLRMGQREPALQRLARLNATAADDSPFLLLGLQTEIAALRAAGRAAAADRASVRLMALLDVRPGKAASTLHVTARSYDFQEWSALANKANLARLLHRHGSDVRFPATYVMPEERSRLRREARDKAVWIVKPTGTQGGQGITLTDALQPALQARQAVVQRYVEPPYLVQGRKAHIRLYVLVTSAVPLRFYVHSNGIVRFAPRPYARTKGWLGMTDMHVTNTALHRDNPLLVLSQDASADSDGHVWSLKGYLAHVPAGTFEATARLAGRFVQALRWAGVFARQAAAGPPGTFAPKLFGCDILLDEQARPWLIEIQRSPTWRGIPLVERINDGVAEAMARMASAPLGANNDPAEIEPRTIAVEAEQQGGFVRILQDADESWAGPWLRL